MADDYRAAEAGLLDEFRSRMAAAGDQMFSQTPHAGDQYNALEQMVRHPAVETALVLDALGRHLPDKNLAKAARKAAMRHRSWMANHN